MTKPTLPDLLLLRSFLALTVRMFRIFRFSVAFLLFLVFFQEGKNSLNIKFLGGIFLGHPEPRRRHIPDKNFMQVARCFRQGVAGMSRDLGRDVSDLGKTLCKKLWADLSYPSLGRRTEQAKANLNPRAGPRVDPRDRPQRAPATGPTRVDFPVFIAEGQEGTAGRGRDRKCHDNFRHFSDNFRHFYDISDALFMRHKGVIKAS